MAPRGILEVLFARSLLICNVLIPLCNVLIQWLGYDLDT